MENKTVGAVASDLLSKHNESLSPQEVAQAQEREYLANLEWAVRHAQKKVDCYSMQGHDQCRTRDALDGSFFVAVLLKKEKLLENVLRNYFVATKACPTPTYDQTIYRYNHEKEDVEYIWTIPDRETCLTFKENASIIVPAERQLLQCVLNFYDGTYYKMMKKFNGEEMTPGGVLVGV